MSCKSHRKCGWISWSLGWMGWPSSHVHYRRGTRQQLRIRQYLAGQISSFPHPMCYSSLGGSSNIFFREILSEHSSEVKETLILGRGSVVSLSLPYAPQSHANVLELSSPTNAVFWQRWTQRKAVRSSFFISTPCSLSVLIICISSLNLWFKELLTISEGADH